MPTEAPRKPANVRSKQVMDHVEAQIRDHYLSQLVDTLKEQDFKLDAPHLEIYMAHTFGFCAGVRRAIEIAYATRASYPDKRVWLIGEIIHNPEVNARLDELGLIRLPWKAKAPDYDQIQAGDVVLIPAFGVTVGMRAMFTERGAILVDSTCGHVMKVWMKVAQHAKEGFTSVIHGKAKHEESMAIASHARGVAGDGKFLIVYSQADADVLADTLTGKRSHEEFLAHFKGSYSVGFDPACDLLKIGMANQTTMLRGDTLSIQNKLHAAMVERDGNEDRFRVCDTICGATQNRQNALHELLELDLDTIFIVGGYNSSNTTHLAHIASEKKPTYFIASAECIESLSQVRAFNLKTKREELMDLPACAASFSRNWRVGITAGASCPANLIEAVIKRLLAIRSRSQV